MKQAISGNTGFLAELAANFKLLIGQMSFGLMGNPKPPDIDAENVTHDGPISREKGQSRKVNGDLLKTVREWQAFISVDSIRHSLRSDKPPVNS